MTTPRRPRRLVLIDPCLTGPGSHPYHYAELLHQAAMRAGCECLIVTHRDCTTAPPGWRALPAFTHTAYSKYTLSGGLDRLDARGRPPWLPRSPWARRHGRRRREERIATFAREVLPALDGLAAGDAVLVATASELEAAGLAWAMAATRPPRGVGWHVQFHLPILRGFSGDFARQEPRLAEARALLRSAAAAAAPNEVQYHATTEELAAEHERLVPGPVGVLPYPVDVPPRAAGPATGPLRIACLGDARPEKHAECLAAIVRDVVADPRLAAAVRFAVQTNLGFPAASRRPEHVAVARSLTTLARAAAAGAPVELLVGPLTQDAYSRELAAADVVLLPYDQGRYRSRCSGIVLEALATGAVPIVTGGGWMARQVEAAAGGHAAAVVAGSRELATQRLERPRLGRRPLVIGLAAQGAASAAGATAVAVEVTWDDPPGDRRALPPVRVAVTGGATRPATSLSAAGGVATAIFPLTSPGRPLVELAAACGAACAVPAAITVRSLATAAPAAASAVGLVIDAPADVPAAIREIVLHAGHYRATAAAHALSVRHAATADAVLRRLLP